MKRIVAVDTMRLAKILGVTFALFGLLIGIAGFVGLTIAKGVAKGAMGSAFTFMKNDIGEQWGGMTVSLSKDIAKYNGVEQAKLKKMFPDGNEKVAITEINSALNIFISNLFGLFRVAILIVAPIKLGIIGFIAGWIGGTVYNKLGGLPVESE